jgi:hypothetical protein
MECDFPSRFTLELLCSSRWIQVVELLQLGLVFKAKCPRKRRHPRDTTLTAADNLNVNWAEYEKSYEPKRWNRRRIIAQRQTSYRWSAREMICTVSKREVAQLARMFPTIS